MNQIKLFFLSAIFTTHAVISINFQYISVQEFLLKNPQAKYTSCLPQTPFHFEMFPFSINPEQQPNTGFFKETFILSIPHARALPLTGCVITEKNQVVKDLLWKGLEHNIQFLKHVPKLHPLIVRGTVALISQPGCGQYWHWLSEMLGRLALLEMEGVSYDYLVIPASKSFMKESLQLWGIDPKKIAELPLNPHYYVQADELIIPSLVSSTNYGMSLFSCYAQPDVVKYISTKLLAGAQKNRTDKKLCKRFFVSRNDTNIRRILNEDEVFAMLQPYGFERYELSNLSVTDQINLFHDAEIIVAPQGTCLANIIFCRPETKIVELFQGLSDSTFWYLSQSLQLDYTPVLTTDLEPNYYSAWSTHTTMSLSAIEYVIKTIIDPT